MLKSITVNYEARGVLGERESRSDHREHDIDAKWVDKAVEFVLRRDSDIGFKAAHFTHGDGSNDCIWQECADGGTRFITWRHDKSEWSCDEPVRISTADFKRRIKKALQGR